MPGKPRYDRIVKFEETGMADCSVHGVHSDWTVETREHGGRRISQEEVLVCNLCREVIDKTQAERTKERKAGGVPSKAMIFQETGKAKCKHHGEHSEWTLKWRTKKHNGKPYSWLSAECKLCVRERAQRHREKRPEYQDEYRFSRRGVITRALGQARTRAKATGVKYNLTHRWVNDQVKKQEDRCRLSGLNFVWDEPETVGQVRLRVISIDRIDSGGDYTEENCQLVLAIVNRMKWELSNEQFVEYCQAVARQAEMA